MNIDKKTKSLKAYRIKTVLLITLCFFMFLSTLTVSSHPGRTDANGGHWDRKSGTYHFHTGEYAGKGSGGSSSSEYVPFKRPKISTEKPTEKPTTKSKSNSVWNVIASIFGIALILWFGITLVFGLMTIILTISGIIYDCCLEKHLPRYKINLLNNKINEFQRYQNKNIEMNIKTFDSEIKNPIPDLYEIGKDNLPKDKNSNSDWGKSFTLYKSAKGSKLHKKYSCCFATKPIHIYTYRNKYDFSECLCRKCAYGYIMSDMSWYEDYLKYEQVKKEQQNIEKSCDKLQVEIKHLHKKCNSIKTKFLIIFCKKNKKALQKANEKYKEIW